jgi:DNA-binding GntR family transcriptional regulator
VVTVRTKPAKTDRVYSELRADILAGRFQPGQRLRYAELCERYGTSMGVLRESMLRLAEQALIRGEAQHGFHVAPLSVDDLLELTDTRREVEGLTLRRALRDGDVEWEARVLAAHHRLTRTAQLDANDPDRLSDAWVAAHAEFHTALLDGCANQRLKSMAAGLRDSAELYRRWSVPFGHEPDRDIPGEHAAILDAALARNLEGGVALLSAHIDRTTAILLASPAGGTAWPEAPTSQTKDETRA